MFEEILEGLNEAQREVALAEGGAILVLAGAGSGKTKTLVARARVLIARGVDPRNICAMTFTNKAAKEMKERLFGGCIRFSRSESSFATKEPAALTLRHRLRPMALGVAIYKTAFRLWKRNLWCKR